MKRPTWATVVGVLCIVFGCFGILGAGQEMMMPTMIKFQKEMFTQVEGFMQTEMAKQEANRSGDDASGYDGPENPEFPLKIFKSIQKMMDFPPWYATWIVISGFLKLIIGGLLLFTAISMLQLKPFSISLFYWTIGLGIALAVIRCAVSFFASSFLGFIMMSGGLFGIVIDIVLLIVVITGDKAAFGYREAPAFTY